MHRLAVQADGAELTTVEGLAPPAGQLHPLQQAFREQPRPAVRLLHAGLPDDRVRAPARTRGPTEEEIREAIAGNLCRCTGYQGIVEAIQLADERWER